MRSGDAVPHTPRGLVAGRVRLPPEGWNFLHVLGALDGKHIPIRCPQGEAASIAMTSASTFLKHTDLRHKIEDGSIGFRDSESLGIGGPKVNFFILGDDAFPFKLLLMRPYSRHGMDIKERVFNYKISWRRRVGENAFRFLTSCFRIFQSPLQQEPPVVNRVVMACLVLHNLLRIRYPTPKQEDFG